MQEAGRLGNAMEPLCFILDCTIAARLNMSLALQVMVNPYMRRPRYRNTVLVSTFGLDLPLSKLSAEERLAQAAAEVAAAAGFPFQTSPLIRQQFRQIYLQPDGQIVKA
eukprot:gnl/MRDRNA2_/MRDRNA2_505388_c0_seq1.p1 gnl/MRDRNA2_/MRDRNA2_505388_c0~~gnl/MRDRNA2_/MRDRNA2_505388_c0_seq1.p1  ORF type:complete len:122 (+),score=20.33 gnl/MRDRNA2_/MRDRNA2_505388_c0_seq1:41-367(+)